MISPRAPLKTLCAWLLLAAPRAARADVFSLWGADPAALAQANARAATATDGTAVHHNPAGLALGQDQDAEAGVLLSTSRLRAGGQRSELDQSAGLFAAGSFSLHSLEAIGLRIGFLLHTPPQSLLRVRVREANAPQFPYYENRSQRLVVAPGLGLRPARWLGVGASVDALASLLGTASLQPGPRGADEPRVEQQVRPVLRPIFGAQFLPSPRLRIALVYRGAFAVGIDTRTDATVAGIPLEARVQQGQALFDPATAILAVAWVPTRRLAIEIDGGYHRWSQYQGPLLQVKAELPGVRAEPTAQPPSFRDTVSVRLGGEVRVLGGMQTVRVRGGLGAETSFLGDERQGETNLVDGTKLVLAAGAAYELTGVFLGGTLVFALGVQLHHLPERSWTKVACTATPCPADTVVGPDASAPSQGISDPGYPTLRGGGNALAAAFSLGSRW